jgi:hypothetical protein
MPALDQIDSVSDSGQGSEGKAYKFPSENILGSFVEDSEGKGQGDGIVVSRACIRPGCNKMLMRDSLGTGREGVPLTNNYGQEALGSGGGEIKGPPVDRKNFLDRVLQIFLSFKFGSGFADRSKDLGKFWRITAEIFWNLANSRWDRRK